ncbi:aminopeptidase P family protein [Aestuariispira insulae]|uniref:Xaa-Pro aminopeptidase n=1 Tax=Aestuariispira insulae TaxID=1461337 RepID=A0A3D9HXA5_9PROT|nr:aminopeptidase P family protein [Aestuariispira insulae]RED54127.1 Xaa-Pro aminopeptidase [Aestuariispira insulae]
MTYQGDSRLNQLLLENSAAMDAGEVRNLIRGVLAAPNFGDGWFDLIAPAANDALKTELSALRSEIERECDAGFTDGPAPRTRIDALRAYMKEKGLAAFIVPRTDRYQGEYVPARFDRLLWLTGYSGSAGLAVIGQEKAAMFVDGRYTLQVRQQTEEALFEYRHLITEPAWDWIAETFKAGDRIAYDPWLHSAHGLKRLQAAVQKIGAILEPLDENPIDLIWQGQPEEPVSPVRPHALDKAGESAVSKRERLGALLSEKQIDSAVITATDSIAWLLNIRGRDVPNCPLPLSAAILHADGAVELFIDDRKLTQEARESFGNAVSVQAPGTFGTRLEALGLEGRTVLADPAGSPSYVFDRLNESGAKLVEGEDPCLLPRACKNDVELAGMRAAHKRDGAAIVKFLAWFDAHKGDEGLSELDVIEQLAAFRNEDPTCTDASFDTIAGSGPNGAVIHYRATEKTNRRLDKDSLLLVDSGAQYPDGTTDITRTMPTHGTPSEEMKERFTLVLKGHIQLAMARFPEGIPGQRLDTLARAPLWSLGLDYDHGTGHGVGSYLNVHEGPQRIASAGNPVPLRPGMILSNEPGYYKDGDYGIRIENLVIVTELDGGLPEGKKVFGFETITLAPIEPSLIKVDLLSEAERDWLNAYHAKVLKEIGPLVDGDELAWLEKATAAI